MVLFGPVMELTVGTEVAQWPETMMGRDSGKIVLLSELEGLFDG